MIKTYILLILIAILPSVSYAEILHTRIHGVVSERSVKHAVRTIDSSKKGDTVKISIDSGGGSVSAMAEVVIAILSTEANISCTVHNEASSAAAVILMYCTVKIIPDNAFIMFHFGSDERGIPIRPGRNGFKHSESIMKDCCMHVITKREQTRMYKYAADVALSGKTLRSRLIKLGILNKYKHASRFPSSYN